MTNIAESLKESAAGALSEHGYTGYPNNNPPGLPDDSMPADLLQGKALQSHLTALPLNTVTCRTALAVPTNLYADYTNATNWVEAYNLNLLSWGTIINADLASGNPVPVFTDVIALSTGNIAGWNSAYIRYGEEQSSYAIWDAQMAVNAANWQYMIIEVNGSEALQGCVSPVIAGPATVLIPLPGLIDPNVDHYYQFAMVGYKGQYGSNIPYPFGLFYFPIPPPPPPPFPIYCPSYPDLATFQAAVSSSTGPDWNPGLACMIPSGPPFA